MKYFITKKQLGHILPRDQHGLINWEEYGFKTGDIAETSHKGELQGYDSNGEFVNCLPIHDEAAFYASPLKTLVDDPESGDKCISDAEGKEKAFEIATVREIIAEFGGSVSYQSALLHIKTKKEEGDDLSKILVDKRAENANKSNDAANDIALLEQRIAELQRAVSELSARIPSGG